ncbi:MAG: hypothetical protein ABI821_01525 [Pseudomonadota bacterium]
MNAVILGSVVLAIAGGAGIAHAAEPLAVEQPATVCTYRAEPVVADAPIKQSTLTVLARQPAEDGEVRRDTLIALDLEYRIKDFAAGSFNIMPMFKTAGDFSSAPGGPSDYPPLEAAAGKVHLCVPLDEMYRSPTLEWPITIVLNLMQSLPGGSMMINASAPPLKFKAADAPEEGLARQAARPPIEYYDNLKTVWNFFESRLARYKACNQRFPEGQAALTKSYRRWEARHADAIQLGSELQFDFLLYSENGNTARATYMFDALRSVTLRSYAQQPAEVLQRQCAVTLSEFSDPEDLSDNVINDEIAYLRKWQATHEKAKTP